MKNKKIISFFITLLFSCYLLNYNNCFQSIIVGKTVAIEFYDEVVVNEVKYNVYSEHAEVVGYSEKISEEVVITNKIKEIPVTKIAEDAFIGLEILKSVTIPETVTEIDDYAFCRCNNLDKIEGMKNVKSIGWASFSACEKLKELTLPNSLETIGAYAFYECRSLTAITIPDSVTDLGAGAFFECEELVSVKLSDNITELKSDKDEHTTPTPYYGTFGKCLSLKEIILPEKLEKIGEGSFDACCSLEKIHIPKNVKEIGNAAFRTAKVSYRFKIGDDPDSCLEEITVDNANSYFCSMDGVLYNKECNKIIQYPLGRDESVFVVPESVIFIGDSAFYDSSICEITFLGNIEEIEDEAFWCCRNLTGIELPQSLKRIGIDAFGNIKFKNIVIPESVDEIGWGAFVHTNLKEVKILNPNCKIENDAIEYFSGVIYGYECSTAQTYAEKYGYSFEPIKSEFKYHLGDINNDEQINAVDASSVLAYYAKVSTDQDGGYSEVQKAAADVNNDGSINSVDASNILAYYAYVSTTQEEIMTIERFMNKAA